MSISSCVPVVAEQIYVYICSIPWRFETRASQFGMMMMMVIVIISHIIRQTHTRKKSLPESHIQIKSFNLSLTYETKRHLQFYQITNWHFFFEKSSYAPLVRCMLCQSETHINVSKHNLLILYCAPRNLLILLLIRIVTS